MELQAITCPNCGANTTNRHNCDYCGSFLVQKVGTNVDIQKYKGIADTFYHHGLHALVQKYASILSANPSLKNFCCDFRSNNDKDFIIQLFPSTFIDPDAPNGFSILITYETIAGKNFESSNVASIFDVIQESGGTSYLVDFGLDSEGASLVLAQLIKEVWRKDIDKLYCQIGISEDREKPQNYAIYNLDGDILQAAGDGKTDFNTMDGVIKEDRLVENEENGTSPGAAKKGCAGMMALLLSAGSAITYGLIELIKNVLA